MTDLFTILVARAKGSEPLLRPRVDPYVRRSIPDPTAERPDPRSSRQVPVERREAAATPPAVNLSPPSPAAQAAVPTDVPAAPLPMPSVPRVELVAHPTIRVVRTERAVRSEAILVERRSAPPGDEAAAAAVTPPSPLAAARRDEAPAPAVRTPVPATTVMPRPAPSPASSAPSSRPADQTVHITIGRLEIRATAPARSAAPPAEPGRREPPIASLDDYLQQRAGRSQ
jgi:hypothetical protein